MTSEPNIVILKDDKKDFKTVYVPMTKFNENYYKYTSNSHNEFFIIPVSDISNLFMIYQREDMPEAFRPMIVSYDLQIIKMTDMLTVNREDNILCDQKIQTAISTPFELFTFLYNLRELSLFNFLFNDGRYDDTYMYVLSHAKITGQGIEREVDIFGVNELISLLESIVCMTTRNDICYKIHLNEDGSCAYSNYHRYDDESRDVRDEMLGNLNLKDNYIETITLPYFEEPIYSFAPKDILIEIEELERYDMFNFASITLFMGTPFGTNIIDALETSDGNIFLSDADFAYRHTSKITIKKLRDMLMYTKLAPNMLRAIAKLTQMSDEMQSLSDVYPGFNYVLKMQAFDLSKPFRYAKNYIYHSYKKDTRLGTRMKNTDISIDTIGLTTKIDIFGDLCKDIDDYWIPF